jgi:3'(2'), 5'-bisphosphate nucleotidase
MNRLSNHLFIALLAAKEAGRAILEIYNKDFDVWYKNDKTPLTMADQRSHDIIVAYLSDQAVDGLPILSEEGKDIPFKQRSRWEYFWLVDPLDGTKEFVKRNGEFTVNIALVHRNRPVLGVIYVPVKDVLYFAAEGLGAYKSDGSDVFELIRDKASEKEKAGLLRTIIDRSVKLPVNDSQNAINDSRLTIVGSRSHSTKEIDDFVEAMEKKYKEIEFISVGSSLKFCLVAERKADVYPRQGSTMEWDTAAGQVIVEQAKGSVLNLETDEPLRYNKEKLLNPWFIVRKKPA